MSIIANSFYNLPSNDQATMVDVSQSYILLCGTFNINILDKDLTLLATKATPSPWVFTICAKSDSEFYLSYMDVAYLKVTKYSFDGSTITELSTSISLAGRGSLYYQNGYLFIGCTDGVYMLNEDTLAIVGSYTTADVFGITGDGSYTYAGSTTEVVALGVSGSSLSLIDSIPAYAYNIGYSNSSNCIVALDNNLGGNNLLLISFDGSNLSQLSSYPLLNIGSNLEVIGDDILTYTAGSKMLNHYRIYGNSVNFSDQISFSKELGHLGAYEDTLFVAGPHPYIDGNNYDLLTLKFIQIPIITTHITL